MSENSRTRSDDFLKIADQFKLGALVTEFSHPMTEHLSDAAREDVALALDLLFQADLDVLGRYREFADSGRAAQIKAEVMKALKAGGRIFFTGCGSTGRLSIQLDSIWRDFWQQQKARGLVGRPIPEDWENRTVSVMAGGDFALIRAVEGFEDFTEFGKKQMVDLGVCSRDVVFSITEGGETSFVIGTAWAGIEAGAKVYFIYNNPDDILCRHVQRSREVIEDERIEKINLTTGPMSVTGSTRMQATSIQLCVLLTMLEMVVRDLMKELEPGGPYALNSSTVPQLFLHRLEDLMNSLRSSEFLRQLAELVRLEEGVYRDSGRVNYFADRFALDVLTDTTERSPTFSVPPFRKFDDTKAADSWAFLFMPEAESIQAWSRLFKRHPRCVEWNGEAISGLVSADKFERTVETLGKIGLAELMRYRIGRDGLNQRLFRGQDAAIAVLGVEEQDLLAGPDGYVTAQLKAAAAAGAKTGIIWIGTPFETPFETVPGCLSVHLPISQSTLLLSGIQRVGLKMVLNALSTCTMVRMGRVMGNYMIWVVPSNLKLIDRATRFVQRLTELSYEEANRLLFEVIEYVEPRMRAGQACPPVVGVAVLRHRNEISNEEAERRVRTEF